MKKHIGWRRRVVLKEEVLDWKGWLVFTRNGPIKKFSKSLIKREAFYLKRKVRFKRKRVWLEKGGLNLIKQSFLLNKQKYLRLKQIRRRLIEKEEPWLFKQKFFWKRRATLKQMLFGKGFCKSKQKRTSEKEELCILGFWLETVEKNFFNRKGTDFIETNFDQFNTEDSYQTGFGVSDRVREGKKDSRAL